MASRTKGIFSISAILLGILLTPPIKGDAHADLQAIEQEYYQWKQQRYPESATATGVHTYDDQVDDFDLSVFKTDKAKVDGFISRLQNVTRTGLTRKEGYSYAVLMDNLQTFSDGYKWKLYGALNPVNFLEGDQIDPNFALSTLLFDNKGDFENYIARLTAMPIKFNQYINRFKLAVQVGTTYNRVSVERVPKQISNLLVTNPVESVYYKPFNDSIDKLQIPDSEKADLQTRGRNAVSGLISGYRLLKEYIEKEYLLHTRGSVGVGGWHLGGMYYEACLKWHISVDYSPGQVHEIGLREVARISAEMREIMRKQGYTGSISEYYNSLKKQPRFHLDSADALLNEYKNIIYNRIYPQLPRAFKNIPSLNVTVQPNPVDGISGQYLDGTADGSRPGIFEVNLFRPNETNTFGMMSLALHETVPGHHLQSIYAMTANLPAFQSYIYFDQMFAIPLQFPFYSAYVEGWALYAESLGEYLGIYRDDYERMGRYGKKILRACRLVVDTGLHFMGWSRDRAIQYMRDNTPMSEKDTEIEIDRYITWPGQACAYKIGEMKIKELRQKAMTALGSKFDIRDFHSVILENGPVPLKLMETIVDDWIRTTSGVPIGSGIVG